MNRKTLHERLFGKLSLGRLLRSLLFIYVAVGAYGYFFSDSLIFRPQPASYQDNQAIIKLTTANRATISALYLPNSDAFYTLLYSHGNAEDLGDIRPILEQLHNAGFAVFAYDYQGYGTSQGKPSEQNAYRDIAAAYRYLTAQLKLSPERIIIYGRSVGGGPSVELASRQPVAGLILESTFTSTFRVITRVPLYPVDKFANLSKLSSIHCPVLVIHGTDDRTIPFEQGQALFQHANQPKRFLAVEGADHNDIISVAGDRYIKAIREFARSIHPITEKKS